jgi:hypothetical protein
MSSQQPDQITKFDLVQYNYPQNVDNGLDPLNTEPNTGRGFSDGFRLPPKDIAPSFADVVPNGTRFPFGQPVYQTDGSREPVSNKMNNVTPASGGFQQFFRILPNNMNEERLTTLSGTWGGPANPVIKNGGTTLGAISHPAKLSKTTANYQPMQTRGQGQGGAITAPEGRPDFQKTRRTTNRQETGLRADGLELGPGQYMVAEAYGSAYNDPMRWSKNRVNPDRAGNGGRMNVRADPVGAGGANTTTRLEAGALPVRPADASRGSRYLPNQYDRLNVFKGQKDFRSTSNNQGLGLANNVLKGNPFAHSFSVKAETGTPLIQPVN